MAVRETLDDITLEPGRAVYDLYSPARQSVVRIMRASINGRDLALVGAWDAPAPSDAVALPRFLHTTRNESFPELVLTPAPDDAYILRLEVALRPRRNATALAPDLFDLWVDAVVAGAVSAAKRVPDQPFSDLNGAILLHAEFRSHITRARTNAVIGRVNTHTRVRARPFA